MNAYMQSMDLKETASAVRSQLKQCLPQTKWRVKPTSTKKNGDLIEISWCDGYSRLAVKEICDRFSPKYNGGIPRPDIWEGQETFWGASAIRYKRTVDFESDWGLGTRVRRAFLAHAILLYESSVPEYRAKYLALIEDDNPRTRFEYERSQQWAIESLVEQISEHEDWENCRLMTPNDIEFSFRELSTPGDACIQPKQADGTPVVQSLVVTGELAEFIKANALWELGISSILKQFALYGQHAGVKKQRPRMLSVSPQDWSLGHPILESVYGDRFVTLEDTEAKTIEFVFETTPCAYACGLLKSRGFEQKGNNFEKPLITGIDWKDEIIDALTHL